MKKELKKKLVPILGVAGLALTGLSAHAQTAINYNDGDLILDFSQAVANDDVEVDIGNLATLQANSGGSAFSLGNFSSDITAAGGSLNSLSFSVIGQQFNQNGSINAGTLYLSQKQSGVNPNTPPTDLTLGNQSLATGKVLAIEGLDATGNPATKGLLPWSASFGTSPTTALIPTSGLQKGNSYTVITSTGFAGAPANVKNTTPASFTSSVISDLFTYDPTTAGSGNPSVYDGYFTFNSTGEVDFTSPAPVPEPATYGMLAGAGLLVVAFSKQLRRKQA
jgi:hypothetical protein